MVVFEQWETLENARRRCSSTVFRLSSLAPKNSSVLSRTIGDRAPNCLHSQRYSSSTRECIYPVETSLSPLKAYSQQKLILILVLKTKILLVKNKLVMYTTVQKIRVGKIFLINVFEKNLFCSHRLHLCNQKYSIKN